MSIKVLECTISRNVQNLHGEIRNYVITVLKDYGHRFYMKIFNEFIHNCLLRQSIKNIT